MLKEEMCIGAALGMQSGRFEEGGRVHGTGQGNVADSGEADVGSETGDGSK